MKKIRQSSFETNSSSAHSISLGTAAGKEFILDTIYPDENGLITLKGGEFGWQWERSNDPEVKANYAAASLKDHDTLFRVISDHTLCEEVQYVGSDDYDSENWSYVDHESIGVCPNDYFGLKDFIFNRNSWLFLGNDNEDPNPTFFDVPEFTSKSKIQPKYKFELKVECISEKIKFKEYPTEEELNSAFRFLCKDYVMLESGLVSRDLYDQLNLRRKEHFDLRPFYKEFDVENKILYFCRDMDDTKRADETIEQFQNRRKEFYDLPENYRSLKFEVNEISER